MHETLDTIDIRGQSEYTLKGKFYSEEEGIMKRYVVAIFMLSLFFIVGFNGVSDAADADYNWTGVYVGINAGGVINASRYNLTPSGDYLTDPTYSPNNSLWSDSGQFNNTAFTAGGQAGFNYQINKFLIIGIETDFNYNGLNKSDFVNRYVNDPDFPGPFMHTVKQKIDYFGTLRARLGFAPINRLLLYGTGGLAYGHVSSTSDVSFDDGATFVSGSTSSLRLGWTAGGGAEYTIGKNWTIKTEYLYVDLGSQSYTSRNDCPVDSSCNYTYATNLKSREHVVRLGINYKF
jgi:outer membrane immunogenic protein